MSLSVALSGTQLQLLNFRLGFCGQHGRALPRGMLDATPRRRPVEAVDLARQR
jgi:hypothetical protein